MSEVAVSTEVTSMHTEHTSGMNSGASVAGGSDDPSGDEWWETPLSDYREAVAVDPSYFAIDDSELALERSAAIEAGTASPGTALPFLDRIQTAFGPRHDLAAVHAHTGEGATSAADLLGANAFATGSHVVFGGMADLWTVAHEATHLVQQSAGVQPDHGVGSADDTHEQRANTVADLVVSGGAADLALADYSPFQFGNGLAQAAPAGVVQLDRKPKKGAVAPARAAPALASDATSFSALKDGETAVLHMEQGAEYADALYAKVMQQAALKATHERIEVSYKDASEQREKMLEVTTFEKIVGGVTAVIDFATSLSGLISAARTLHAAASLRPITQRIVAREATRDDHLRETELRGKLEGKSKLKAVGDLVNDGNDVRKEVGKLGDDNADPDATFDPETILPNANAAAIKAGNDALISFVDSDAALNFVKLQQYGGQAALAFKHMVEGIALIAKDATPLTAQSFGRFESILTRFESARARYISAVDRVASLVRAYQSGGAAGIADPKERSVFETLQQWKQRNDPRAKGVRFALDQDSKSIHFGDVHIDVEVPFGGGSVTHYYCYPFREQTHRSEDATLYVSDGAAATELRKLGLSLAPTGPNGTVGDAERTEDKPGSGIKFSISASIAKAIESLGIPGTANEARVQFYSSTNAPVASVTNKQRGAWFEDWRSTPQFEAFWQIHLGGEYAYLMSSDGKRQTIPAAAKNQAVMARSAVLHPVQGGVI